MPHEEYLDEPAENIDWMLRMRRLEQEIEADERRRQQAQQRGRPGARRG